MILSHVSTSKRRIFGDSRTTGNFLLAIQLLTVRKLTEYRFASSARVISFSDPDFMSLIGPGLHQGQYFTLPVANYPAVHSNGSEQPPQLPPVNGPGIYAEFFGNLPARIIFFQQFCFHIFSNFCFLNFIIHINVEQIMTVFKRKKLLDMKFYPCNVEKSCQKNH